MDITQTDIAEYKALYRLHFDVELDDSQAYRQLVTLTLLTKSVYQPILRTTSNTNEDEETKYGQRRAT